MKKLTAAVLLATLTSTTGCSAFRASTQMVNITCTEPDAVVMVNGQRYTPPAQVQVKRNNDLSIQAHKQGFVPYQRTIGHSINGTGAADVLGLLTWLVPGIGLLTPGAYSLNETDVHVQLYPMGEEKSY